jgi:predicted nuclease with TOPRIM domain
MVIHSKVLGRDFSCDAKDAAETMKAVLALEAAAKAEEEDDFLASALDDVLMELDKNYDEQDKLEAEIDELEVKIAEVESKLSEVYDRIDELEAEEAELEELMDELTDDEDDDCCEWDCDCDDCPDREACYDEDDEDEDEDVSEIPYHCAAVIIKNGDEEKRVPADFSAVIDAILEMLEDEEDDLDY